MIDHNIATAHAYWLAEVTSLAGIGSSLLGILPPIATLCATLMAIVWYGCMIADWIKARRTVKPCTPQEKDDTNA